MNKLRKISLSHLSIKENYYQIPSIVKKKTLNKHVQIAGERKKFNLHAVNCQECSFAS